MEMTWTDKEPATHERKRERMHNMKMCVWLKNAHDWEIKTSYFYWGGSRNIGFGLKSSVTSEKENSTTINATDDVKDPREDTLIQHIEHS